MFCSEKIIAVYEMRPMDDEGLDSFFKITDGLAYHTMGGRRMLFETQNFYISIGADGVRKFRDKQSFTLGDYDMCPVEPELEGEGPCSFEARLFVGERLVEVLKKADHFRLRFNHFTMGLYAVKTERPWFYYRSNLGEKRVSGCRHLLRRRCGCGGQGEVWMDSESDYFVRCRECHAATWASWILDDVIKAWNRGDTPRSHETAAEHFERCLRNESINYIALGDKGLWFLDDDLCDTNQIVIAFETTMFMLNGDLANQNDRTKFDCTEICAYNEELFPKKIRPSEGGQLRFYDMYTEYGTDYLLLSIDDIHLCITAQEGFLMVGISNPECRVDYTRETLII